MPASDDLAVLTPKIEVKINGEDLITQAGQKVSGLEFDEIESGDDKITLKISDDYAQLVDSPLLAERNEIEVSWGYAGNMSKPRKGIMLQPTFDFGETVGITIEALDKGSKLHGRAEQKVWQNMTYSDIVIEVSAKHGLKPFIEPTSQVHESVPQGNRSDWDFLQYLASQVNYIAFIDVDELHFHKREKNSPPVLTLHYFHAKSKYLLNFQPKINLQQQKGEGTEVTGIGFDPFERQAISHVANADSKDTPALGKQTLLIDLDTGDTKYTETETGHVNATPHQTLPEVEKEAETQRQNAELKQSTATFNLIGLPHIKAKEIIEIFEVGEKFSGRWYITRAHHSINDSGYTLELETRRDAAEGEAGQSQEEADSPSQGDGEENQDDVVQIDLETGEVID